MSERTYWKGHRLNHVEPEGLLISLMKYKPKKDRTRVSKEEANLISSRCENGKHKPILDLDFRHSYIPSTKPGHGHLYLDTEVPFWRLALLLIALRLAGATELGFTAWSLRRRATFVRVPGLVKTEQEFIRAEKPPEYGWLFKRRPKGGKYL